MIDEGCLETKDFSVELPILIGKLSILEEVLKGADINIGYSEAKAGAIQIIYEVSEDLRAINKALCEEGV